jgi:hypothetical protein
MFKTDCGMAINVVRKAYVVQNAGSIEPKF